MTRHNVTSQSNCLFTWVCFELETDHHFPSGTFVCSNKLLASGCFCLGNSKPLNFFNLIRRKAASCILTVKKANVQTQFKCLLAVRNVVPHFTANFKSRSVRYSRRLNKHRSYYWPKSRLTVEILKIFEVVFGPLRSWFSSRNWRVFWARFAF